MFIDTYQCIVSEQGDIPAVYGDAMAESGRWAHLKLLLGEPAGVDLNAFNKDGGYTRHPSPLLPDDWGVTDTGHDQYLPVFLAMNLTRYQLGADEMRSRIKAAGWKTGNGDYISPMFYALLKDNKVLLNITVALQALFFKIPFRWSDSKKWFESTSASSGDYLNWFHASLYASPWARHLVSKTVLCQKIEHYYRNEPNSKELIKLYKDVINRKY